MEKLDRKEKTQLQEYLNKIINVIIYWGIGMSLFLLIICLIPMKFLPKKRKLGAINGDLNIFESLGILPTFIIIILISGSIVLYLYYSYKIKKLSDDLIELKKITLDVQIKKIIYKEGGGPKELDVYFTPSYKGINKIELIGRNDTPILYEKQTIKLILTRNALYPIRIEDKNDVDNILKILKTL